MSGAITRRYAKALFGLAVEQGKVEAWVDSLQALERAVESSNELRDVLVNPVYAREQRRAILGKLIAALKLEPEPANLLCLLGDRNRLDHLGAIVTAFSAFADEHMGRIRARVISAAPLDATTAESLAAKLASATRAQIVIERAVDPQLLAGVVAQVGHLTYDGSVRTQLETLRATLKR